MLRELARAAGIDAVPELARRADLGERRVDQAGTDRARADLGIDAATFDDPEAAIARLDERRWSECVPPVIVAWDGEVVVPMRVVADVDAAWSLELVLETGAKHDARGALFELPADSHAHPGGVVHCIRRASVKLDPTALGYHQLHWQIGDASGDAMIICAPTRAWGGPSSFTKRWGVFAPVYGLASTPSGQAGNLGALDELFEMTELRGGSYIARRCRSSRRSSARTASRVRGRRIRRRRGCSGTSSTSICRGSPRASTWSCRARRWRRSHS